MCNDEVFIKIICLHKQYFYFFPHDTVLARYVLRSYDVRPFVCLWSIRTPRHVVKKQRWSVAGQHVLTIEYVQYVQVHRIEWLGCRVVSVLDSGAEGPGFKSLSGNILTQTVHTHRASVHQAAKLVAALLRVAGVTASLAESNGSLPPGLDSCHLQADCQEPVSAPEPYAR